MPKVSPTKCTKKAQQSARSKHHSHLHIGQTTKKHRKRRVFRACFIPAILPSASGGPAAVTQEGRASTVLFILFQVSSHIPQSVHRTHPGNDRVEENIQDRSALIPSQIFGKLCTEAKKNTIPSFTYLFTIVDAQPRPPLLGGANTLLNGVCQVWAARADITEERGSRWGSAAAAAGGGVGGASACYRYFPI